MIPYVASFAEAWIEKEELDAVTEEQWVASFAEAWIENDMLKRIRNRF